MAKFTLLLLLLVFLTMLTTSKTSPNERQYAMKTNSQLIDFQGFPPYGEAFRYGIRTAWSRNATVSDPNVPQIIWGVGTTTAFIDHYMVMHAQVDPGERRHPSYDEILVSLNRFVPCMSISDTDNRYERRYSIAEGEFGRVVLVRPRCGLPVNLVEKQAKVETRPDSPMAGAREEYFGHMFRSWSNMPGASNLARFVEAYSESEDFYVISMFEGISLKAALRPSGSTESEFAWWRWLKTSPEGNRAVQDIMKQMITGLSLLHRYNVIHRDLKPGNVALCFYTESGDCIGKPLTGLAYHGLHVRIIDFGSALDNFSRSHLYGADGPAIDTQDSLYMFPDCWLGYDCLAAPDVHLAKYDMFSVGLIFVEIILGVPNWPEQILAVLKSCSSEKCFMNHIKVMDPLKKGFPGIRAARFAQQLLHWDIEKRLSAAKALDHVYFN